MALELSYLTLSFLTFQTVLQVVIICVLGFWAASHRLLTPEIQKHISQLNVQVFTPCLIFSKLASSLSVEKMAEIAIIPILFVVTTAVSLLSSKILSRIYKFNERESNFVTAMSVFGNSNSLPVSLTISLAYSLPGLEWDDIPNDNKDDIASRGILYLLIFQQLGQMVRWSWGYNTLLSKPTQDELLDETFAYSSARNRGLLSNLSGDISNSRAVDDIQVVYGNSEDVGESDAESGRHLDSTHKSSQNSSPPSGETADGNTSENDEDDHLETGSLLGHHRAEGSETPATSETAVPVVERPFLFIWQKILSFFVAFYNTMNPPLWSMLISVIIASVPALKHTFFNANGFIENTITKAIKQVGQVAIPLILVVLGGNLYRPPDEDNKPDFRCPKYAKLVTASILGRMVLPAVVLLPLLSLAVRFTPLSILDDPIFLVVSFLLTVAPPAIQLSQICQINEIFEEEMVGVLFWGYVVLTLPTTLFVVVLSLEVLKWAGQI